MSLILRAGGYRQFGTFMLVEPPNSSPAERAILLDLAWRCRVHVWFFCQRRVRRQRRYSNCFLRRHDFQRLYPSGGTAIISAGAVFSGADAETRGTLLVLSGGTNLREVSSAAPRL